MDLAWDRITCELHARRTVISDTVRVYVQATVTQGATDTAELRHTMVGALTPVLEGTWSVNNVSRSEDDAGMERVRLVATIRVPEHLTSGLVDRLRKANRAGLKLELQRVDYRPPRKQIDAAQREMRQEVFREAQTEADLLNASLPSDTVPWRVGGAQLTETVGRSGETPVGRALAISRSYSSSDARDAEPTEGPNVEAGIQLEVTAKVTLSRLSLPTQFFLDAARKQAPPPLDKES